ncbi:unnamed protein product [Periconia digitata]|uniref:Uncharacterized protein n=1 Tax=Periconia digitata TaxID=1303443 RepID=A0A9W4UQN6_9PLEO|nr:unnamed protein product [Periconia digitata]
MSVSIYILRIRLLPPPHPFTSLRMVPTPSSSPTPSLPEPSRQAERPSAHALSFSNNLRCTCTSTRPPCRTKPSAQRPFIQHTDTGCHVPGNHQSRSTFLPFFLSFFLSCPDFRCRRCLVSPAHDPRECMATSRSRKCSSNHPVMSPLFIWNHPSTRTWASGDEPQSKVAATPLTASHPPRAVARNRTWTCFIVSYSDWLPASLLLGCFQYTLFHLWT